MSNGFSKVNVTNHAAVVASFEVVDICNNRVVAKSDSKSVGYGQVFDLHGTGLNDGDRFFIKADVKLGKDSTTEGFIYEKDSERTLNCELKGTTIRSHFNIL